MNNELEIANKIKHILEQHAYEFGTGVRFEIDVTGGDVCVTAYSTGTHTVRNERDVTGENSINVSDNGTVKSLFSVYVEVD